MAIGGFAGEASTPPHDTRRAAAGSAG